jgi:Flp pilus assembly protein TadD
MADLTQAQSLDPTNGETAQLIAITQAKIDQIVAKAESLEHRSETDHIVLPDTSGGNQVSTVQAVQPSAVQPPAAEPALAAASPPATKSAPLAKAAAEPATPTGDPPSGPAYHARGRQLLQEGHYDGAIQALTQAIQLDPKVPQAYNARGYAHLMLKQYADAVTDFDQAIRLQPGYQNAYTNRAVARKMTGDTAGAAADQALARGLAQAH